MAAVTAQATRLGLTSRALAEATVVGDLMMVEGQAFPKSLCEPRARLAEQIRRDGFEATMEAAAYTWFNRLVAIRYMELHNYLDHGYRVLSHPEGHPRPEILDHAVELDFPDLDRQKALALKLDGTRDEELYRLLLIAQGNALHRSMPFLFERIGGVNELLLPANLLHSDSLIRQLVESIEEEAWQNIEIIGWLYQYYISEKKDQVIGKVVKPEDIPAATQLFTPNWIVKYMVQNSLGAQWLATYPASPLKQQMDYYIEPAQQTPEVLAQLKAITPEALNPEEITLIDPACGSGHILVEAYDLFKSIYLERGYRQRDIPQLILEKNLFGLDIDPRAAQLAGFSLMMKGRADDRRLFQRDVKLNVMAFVNSTDFEPKVLAESRELQLTDFGLALSDLRALKRLFEHATTLGSLIQVPGELKGRLPGLKQLATSESKDMFVGRELDHLTSLVPQAVMLAQAYDVVVANPPYMGSKYLTPLLKKYLSDDYGDYSKDLFSAFIDRNLSMARAGGHLGFMTPFVWMFISSHEDLRKRLIDRETIKTLIQLEYSGFEGATVPICTFTLRKGHIKSEKGCYIRLSDFKGPVNQAPKTLEAIRNRECGWFYAVAQDEFRTIPGYPLAYWVSPRLRVAFSDMKPVSSSYSTRKGMATGANSDFVRAWQEVAFNTIGFGLNRDTAKTSGYKWYPYANGGVYRKWFGNYEDVVNWQNDGNLLQSIRTEEGRIRAVNLNLEYIFRQGICWTSITSSRLSVRELPAGFLFSSASNALFASTPEASCRRILAMLNSGAAELLLRILSPTLNANPGDIGKMPMAPDLKCLEANSENLIKLSRNDWDSFEISWDFACDPLIFSASGNLRKTIEESQDLWVADCLRATAQVKSLEEENNRIFIEAYGLQDELTPEVPLEQVTLTVNPAYRYSGDLTDEQRWARFRQDTMKELVSYAIGCMMGRYSLDEPGLIYAHSGHVGFDSSRYQKFPADEDGILPLTDTEWFEDDAARRLETFLSVAWPAEHLEENLTFLADNLDPNKGESSRETVRRYLCDKFFADHTQVYKKRPIYWLFSSGKHKAFQALVYLHRYHEGTLARMRSEYVIPLQGKMAARLEQLVGDIQADTSTAHRKRLEKERANLEKQQTELLTFDEKLRHYADQRISLDLDDGVRVNYGKFGDLLADVSKIQGSKE